MMAEDLKETKDAGLLNEDADKEAEQEQLKKTQKKKLSYIHKKFQNDEITDEERAQDLFRR